MRPMVALIAAALLTLVGCGSSDTAPADLGSSTVTASTTTAPVALTPEEVELYGPRVELPGGLLLKQIGKVAEYGESETAPRDHWAIRVVVEKIEVDPQCDEYTSEPRRGHCVVVTMSVQTSRYFNSTTPVPAWTQWSTIGRDGVSEGRMSSYYDCREARDLTSEFRPEAKYRGEISIDTANPSGQVVFNDSFAWDYPTAD